MQIGDKIYVDLEIDGLDRKGFLEAGDVASVQIVEASGASLPYVYMKFVCRDEKVKNSIQMGNKVKLHFGTTPSDSDIFEVDLLPSQAKKDKSNSGWIVEFTGFIGNKEYMIGQVSKAYLGSSTIVANEVLKEYLGSSDPKKKNYIVTDFKSVNENQVYWRRDNKTASAFVAETLVHCDVRPDVPLFAFDKYKHFFVRSLNNLIKEGHKVIFTPSGTTDVETTSIKYYNSFNPISYLETYNQYSGYNKVTQIHDASTGLSKSVVDETVPILASTEVSEEADAGNKVIAEKVQSSNVHKTYHESFAYNTQKLIQLSSLCGELILFGEYYKNLKPLDLVYVQAGTKAEFSGLYLIDSIVTAADFGAGTIATHVYVTRDSKNNVENYVTNNKKKKLIKVMQKLRNDILASVQSMKTAYAMSKQFFDGSYLDQVLDFAISTKDNILRAFRISGVDIDFTSSANRLLSLINLGNSLMNTLVSMVFPAAIAHTLWDFLIYKPSMAALISKFAGLYVPAEIRDIFLLLADSIIKTTNSLNSIAKDNGIKTTNTIAGGTVVRDTDITDVTADNQQRVNEIVSGFSDNTPGLNIPFPVVSLTESETLLPEEPLKDLIADKTVQNLTELNYIDEEDREPLKDILLGQEKIDFAIINKIQERVGDTLNYRYWGSFYNLLELTSFEIKKSFKDKYRSLPCTKLVSALKNACIFFACPSREDDVRIYINSKRVDLPSFEVDLGYRDMYGVKMPYTVYYTETGYNSNSVLLEVKQGGMV